MKNNSIIAKRVTEKLLKPKTIWGLSSAGRASALQAEGHRFEPYWSHNSNKRRKIYMPTLIEYADMAQLAEQLICNQQVIGSSPIIGFVPKGTDIIMDL